MSRKAGITVSVPIDKVVPHPDNPNRMSADMREKLTRNIDATGYYPPVIVRSLERSERFVQEREAGLYQILDGEHRWKDCKEQGATEIDVCVWKGISDAQASQLLLTMNRIHGEDVKDKRRELLRQALGHGAPDELSLFLPESEEELKKIADEATTIAETAIQAVRSGEASAPSPEPMTFFVHSEQATVIRAAITRWLAENDPTNQITSAREGEALAAICEAAGYGDDPADDQTGATT